jgi:hypothetical protein
MDVLNLRTLDITIGEIGRMESEKRGPLAESHKSNHYLFVRPHTSPQKDFMCIFLGLGFLSLVTMSSIYSPLRMCVTKQS